MSAAHTPTPWAAHSHSVNRMTEWYLHSADGNGLGHGRHVAVIGRANYSAADAAFIVRACNAHDELVAALRVALKHVERADADSGCIAYMEDAQQVRAALAKVQA